MIMVKPAYPDILSDAKNVSTVPVVAMQVSGEFAMIHAAARAGVFNLKDMAFGSTGLLFASGRMQFSVTSLQASWISCKGG